MTDGAVRWTLSGFLEQFRFVHTNMRDHAYAWMLGAGASKSSGIPLGGDLVKRWLGELHRRLAPEGLSLDAWATEANLGIPGFKLDDAASFYSRVYERRFGDNPDEGFAYLEALMTGLDPSPGYSILAQVLEKTPHKVVISTNFDNLVADALSIYTSTFPLVIGHESLANFVKVVSRRPVICKIHRDLLLGPKNDHRSLRRLHESWAAALRALFSQYTPLFIGYGGNDDSLMDLLESLDPEDIKGQLIWCHHERAAPSDRIVALVRQFRGALVPMPDFDLLMILLGSAMGLEPIDHAIEERAEQRARNYRKRLIDLDTTAYPEVRRALRGAFERAGGTLAWQEKARNEPSTDRREQIYAQALEQYPDDLDLRFDQAVFLWHHDRDPPRARALMVGLQTHDRPLQYRPSVLLAIMDIHTGRLDEVEAILGRIPDEHPNGKSLALAMLREAQKDLAEAERLFRDACAQDDIPLSMLADFLSMHGRDDEAEPLRRKLHTEDPSSAVHTAALAQFLWTVRGDDEAAGKLYRELLELPEVRSGELVSGACFFLASDQPDAHASVMSMLEMRPMQRWRDETAVAFLRLIAESIAGRDGRDALETLRRRLTDNYDRARVRLGALEKLAIAVAPRVPPGHRKFLVALAQAIYDPTRRNVLGSYPQWRAAADAATTTVSATT